MPHTTHMTKPNTTTTAGIRWRKQPTHANLQGWVGIPHHADGEPTPLFRYYVSPLPSGLWDTTLEMNPVGWGWDSTSVTKPVATIEEAQAACVADWQEATR